MQELLDLYLFHWRPEKAIWLGGHTLSWDARCAGIHIGMGIGLLYHLVLGRRAGHLPPRGILFAAAALFVPLFVDVYSARLGLRAPSNEWRFATGLAFGEALSVFVYPAFVTLLAAHAEERAVVASWPRFLGLVAAAGAALALKALGNASAYFILEPLGLLGMSGLLALAAVGAVVGLRSLIGKGESSWGREQGSEGGQRPR